MTAATPELVTARDLAAAIDARGDAGDAAFLQGFFQTRPGGYGEGDRFVGVRVPVLRSLARRAAAMPVDEATTLLASTVHEHRFAALVVLVEAFRRASRPRTRDDALRDELHAHYLRAVRAGQVNGWDLVDVSADRLVGEWLLGPPSHDVAATLDPLAASPSLWQRRVAMLATFAFTRAGDPWPALTYAERLLEAPEDLLHKAVGWMLREVGKRTGRENLTAFLDRQAPRMPRTALSYATEHLDAADRARYRAMR